MSDALTLGFSSCPNDTFMFDALVHGRVDDAPAVVPVIEDIEALNDRACGSDRRARLDVTKLSVGALPDAIGEYAVLATGAALGRGCGPLVVRRADHDLGALSALGERRVAVPGLRTTAWRLLQAFAPSCVPVPMRFDRVMPAVAAGEVDAGLVIHEGRFTYGAHGLVCLADLGELWEADTGLPVPLGVITARRDLPDAVAGAIEAAIGSSVRAAFAEPARSRPWVRELAQELDDDVIDRHIALYVNQTSLGLDDECRRAIKLLLARCGCTASPWR